MFHLIDIFHLSYVKKILTQFFSLMFTVTLFHSIGMDFS